MFLIQCYDKCEKIEFYDYCIYEYNNASDSLSKGFNNKREMNTKKLAKLYYEWAQSQNDEVKNAAYRFII